MKLWSCRVGEVDESMVPHNADGPMRQAVHDAYEKLTGVVPAFIFSGWGDELREAERAVVEDRLPNHHIDTAALLGTTDASVWAREFAKIAPDVDEGLMLGWFANAIETGRSAGQASASAALEDGAERDQYIAALDEARTALRLTREYVGEELLPMQAGWAWFDATVLIDALVPDGQVGSP